MPLKVIDGLRTANHANAVIDFAQLVAAQVNGPGTDMSEHLEAVYVGTCSAVTGSGTGTIVMQESNEASANFTNVTNASLAFNTANTVKVGSVDWRKPNRKRYARLAAFNATNSITLQGTLLRVQSKSNVNLGDNCSQLDS